MIITYPGTCATNILTARLSLKNYSQAPIFYSRQYNKSLDILHNYNLFSNFRNKYFLSRLGLFPLLFFVLTQHRF